MDNENTRNEEKEYPWSLTKTSMLMGFFLKRIYLFGPGVVLVIIGIWSRPCLYVGLGFLALDIIITVVEELIARKVVLKSDNPNFREVQDAILSKNWQKNMMDLVNRKIEENESSQGNGEE